LVNVPVDCEPFTALVPAHEPEAVQLVTLVELQRNVVLPPDAIAVASADNDTVGVLPVAPLTVTVLLACAVPPAPVQLRI
jgi:hypothetical protein